MKKSCFLSILFFLSASLLLHSAEDRPLTFDDFIQIKRLSDIQISPDGDFVAFVLTAMDIEKNLSNSDIWILPVEGGKPRQLTTSPGPDFHPRWSPDGKAIAFISARGGTPQVWIIDPHGGEAMPLIHLSTGISGFIWSPDGKHIAVVSSVFPDCPDDECNRKRNEERMKSPVKAKIFDHLLFRHWNSWRDGKRSHVFVFSLGDGKLQDVTSGDYDAPPISLGSSHDYAFSPDGKEICFVRNVDPEFRISLGTNNDIFTTTLDGKEIKRVTVNKANDNCPHYSPDGRWIAYRAMARAGFEADKYSLMLYERQSKKITNLTEDLDRSVEDILWSSGSDAIFFTFEEKGRMVLARVLLEGCRIERILDGHYFSSPRLSPDGKTVYFLKQALHHPSEIYSFDAVSKKLRKLTDINGSLLQDVEMNPSEEFWFEGAKGDEIHGFLVKPPFFEESKSYPLVLLIHGGPQGAWSDNFHYRWNAQMFASPGYVVAMINFHGSTGYGQTFTDSISGDWGGKPFEDIMKGCDYLLSRYDYIDRERVAAAGASYGGYMVDWIEGHTDRFRCLISHAGVFDLCSMYGETEELWFPEWEFRGAPWENPGMYEKWSPSVYVKNFRTPCLVTHSQNDFRVPVTQGFQFFTALQRMNIPSRMLYFPDEDHFIRKPKNAELWWNTVHEWLAEYLKGESTRKP